MGVVEIVALIITAAAAATSAYATYESAQAQSAAARYNQKVAKQNANTAAQVAEAQAADARERSRRLMAANRADLGAMGIQPESASPLEVMLYNAREAELEARQVQYGGQQQAQSFESQAKLFGFESATARRLGTIGAGATLLTGAARAYGAYRSGPSTGGGQGYGSARAQDADPGNRQGLPY